MRTFTESEKGRTAGRCSTLLKQKGQPLLEKWRARLFPSSSRSPEFGKEYELLYDGKMRRRGGTGADTSRTEAACPFLWCRAPTWGQTLARSAVWGDNLPALRELLADQHGPDRFGTPVLAF